MDSRRRDHQGAAGPDRETNNHGPAQSFSHNCDQPFDLILLGILMGDIKKMSQSISSGLSNDDPTYSVLDEQIDHLWHQIQCLPFTILLSKHKGLGSYKTFLSELHNVIEMGQDPSDLYDLKRSISEFQQLFESPCDPGSINIFQNARNLTFYHSIFTAVSQPNTVSNSTPPIPSTDPAPQVHSISYVEDPVAAVHPGRRFIVVSRSHMTLGRMGVVARQDNPVPPP